MSSSKVPAWYQRKLDAHATELGGRIVSDIPASHRDEPEEGYQPLHVPGPAAKPAVTVPGTVDGIPAQQAMLRDSTCPPPAQYSYTEGSKPPQLTIACPNFLSSYYFPGHSPTFSFQQMYRLGLLTTSISTIGRGCILVYLTALSYDEVHGDMKCEPCLEVRLLRRKWMKCSPLRHVSRIMTCRLRNRWPCEL